NGQARIRNDAIARRLRRRRRGRAWIGRLRHGPRDRAGIAAARRFAQSSFQRSRPRSGRPFVRSSYVRSDALLGRRSAGVGCGRARLRGVVAGGEGEGEVVEHDFAALWRAKPKWVVSRSLKSVGANATLVAGDVEAFVRRLKVEVEGEIDVAGPELAGSLTDLGLIDEYRLYFRPFV